MRLFAPGHFAIRPAISPLPFSRCQTCPAWILWGTKKKRSYFYSTYHILQSGNHSLSPIGMGFVSTGRVRHSASPDDVTKGVTPGRSNAGIQEKAIQDEGSQGGLRYPVILSTVNQGVRPMELHLRCRACREMNSFHLDLFLGRYVICKKCRAKLDYFALKEAEEGKKTSDNAVDKYKKQDHGTSNENES